MQPTANGYPIPTALRALARALIAHSPPHPPYITAHLVLPSFGWPAS